MLDFIGALPGAISQGLVWGIMAIGVYITYRILDIADLTVDGSFCTGGATFVVLYGMGTNLWLALLISLLVGMLAGLVTGVLHTACGIPAILSGILTQLALWSINLAIMGMKANVAINVIDKDNLDRLLVSLRFVQDVAKGDRPFYRHPIFVVGIFTVGIIMILYWFFGTELGASLRATGANDKMARAQGINTNVGRVLGLMISNGLVALSGALLSQYQSFADSSMGKGAIVIGLAAVIIGDVLLGKVFRNFGLRLLAVSIGSIIYYVVIQAVVSLIKINTNYLKLISAVIVALFLSVPYWKGKYFAKHPQRRKELAPMLEIQNLWKTFNPGTVNQKIALQGVELTLNDGDFVTVIGSNGAGKSTMLNAIAGVFPVEQGKIRLDGTDITALPEHRRAAGIGRVFQDPMMGTAATMQIVENLALAARRGRFRGLRSGITRQEKEQYREQLRTLDLGLEDRMTAKVGLLSGGQRQALTLLMATLRRPKLLLLDEHTAALDPATAAKVLSLTDKIVSSNKLTTLMITHNMKDAITHGNRLIMMNEGKVIFDVAGEEKSSLTKNDLLQKFADLSGGGLENDRMLLS